VEDDTGLLDAASAAAVVTPRTAGLIAVHLYGQMCDMARLRELADRHKLFLLEDAAQAHGAAWCGRRAGSVGDAAAFSFYPSKNLGALGDGGAVTTADEGLARRVREMRHLGQRRKGEHVVIGYNERLDGLQASLLRVKLAHLDGWNLVRRGHATVLHEALKTAMWTLTVRPDRDCVYHLYPVRCRNRDDLAQALTAAGIQTGIHYWPTVPDHPAISQLLEDGRRIESPRAHAWAKEELSLPCSRSCARLSYSK
jgi:dTDP-4-amino-4,6-dideoxygalactose transaminase